MRKGKTGNWKEHFSTGVNYINVLCTAFEPVDPKSVKDTYDISGSTSVKAVRRTLMKLSPSNNKQVFTVKVCSKLG
jgi:hypothetical protein